MDLTNLRSISLPAAASAGHSVIDFKGDGYSSGGQCSRYSLGVRKVGQVAEHDETLMLSIVAEGRVLIDVELRAFEKQDLAAALAFAEWKISGLGGVAERLDSNPRPGLAKNGLQPLR